MCVCVPEGNIPLLNAKMKAVLEKSQSPDWLLPQRPSSRRRTWNVASPQKVQMQANLMHAHHRVHKAEHTEVRLQRGHFTMAFLIFYFSFMLCPLFPNRERILTERQKVNSMEAEKCFFLFSFLFCVLWNQQNATV